MSNTGLAARGLQIFLPISPQCLIILYDKDVYHVLGDQNITRDISYKDLELINLLQFVNAERNIFFDSLDESNSIQKLKTIAKRLRKIEKVKTLKFDSVDGSFLSKESMLITSLIQKPNIHLDLSFMKVKRSAQKVLARDRLNARYRREMPEEFNKDGIYPNMPRLFVRRQDEET